MAGTLYLVATPIGNLQDITFRAVEILKTVDIIACEDTRHSRKLLNAFAIKNELVSYHDHNEAERADEFVKLLTDGKSIAVISDAGTPGINDPGFQIVQRCIESAINIVPVPGAIAFVNAAIISGLPMDALFFGGFLPSKKGERRRRIEEVKHIPATVIFYESPHRLGGSLTDCFEVLGDRQAAVVRELTKIHEEVIRGKLRELSERLSSAISKGEIVLVIDRAGAEASELNSAQSLIERIKELEADGSDSKTALKKAAKEFGMSKSEAYRSVQAEK